MSPSARFAAWLVVLPWLLPCVSGADPPRGGLDARVTQDAQTVTPRVIRWRRHLHAHPELSNREAKTAAFVAARLREIGVDDIRTGVAKHGVVALIRGKHPGKVVALRADMDALPVSEQTGLSFASKTPGVMHACGHDVHTAVLLGAAQVLAGLRGQLHGTVKLIFQPAEEGPPAGERGGAELMMEQGVLERPKVDAIFALHTFPELEAGTLGYTLGGAFASVDRFKVLVRGKQTHAAYPWGGIDPIVAAAHVVTALQTIASRTVDPRNPIVVSVGVIRGGRRWNIIPGEVTLEGTVRTHDRRVRSQARKAFERLVRRTAEAYGATASITYEDLAPVVWNDKTLGRRMLPTLKRTAGAQAVTRILPAMGGEDFGYYALKVPGFYFRLGVGNAKKGHVHPLHTPGFQVDERALPLGVRTMSLLALDYLRATR